MRTANRREVFLFIFGNWERDDHKKKKKEKKPKKKFCKKKDEAVDCGHLISQKTAQGGATDGCVVGN